MKRWILIFLFVGHSILWAQTSIDLSNSIQPAIDQIREEIGLQLIYSLPQQESGLPQTFQMAAPQDKVHLENYIRLFIQEIRKYPLEFFQRLKLKQVIFVKKLFYHNRPVEGVYDPFNNRIYLDFLRSHGNRLTQQHNIHHEIYHVIDTQRAGRPQGLKDLNWNNLNPDGFEYGKNTKTSGWRDKTQFMENPVPGFMSAYALTSTEEDKAEIYACLFIESQNKLMYRWAKEDSVLKAKIVYLKNELYQFCPAFDENFWKTIFLRKERGVP